MTVLFKTVFLTDIFEIKCSMIWFPRYKLFGGWADKLDNDENVVFVANIILPKSDFNTSVRGPKLGCSQVKLF